MTDEIQILNRMLRWSTEGITCEADQRHAGIKIKDMNMKKANAVSTPAVPEGKFQVKQLQHDQGRGLTVAGTGWSCGLFESGPTRLAVRGEDSEPAHGSAQGMRLGQDQADLEVPHQRLPGCPKFCLHSVDSDWAGNKITRKSTSEAQCSQAVT